MQHGQSRADAIRETKRSEIIESLKQRGLLQQVIETADKLADLVGQDLDAVQVQRLKAANDARLKVINKYLPDVKSVEHSGSEDKPPIQFEELSRPKLTREEWLKAHGIMAD